MVVSPAKHPVENGASRSPCAPKAAPKSSPAFMQPQALESSTSSVSSTSEESPQALDAGRAENGGTGMVLSKADLQKDDQDMSGVTTSSSSLSSPSSPSSSTGPEAGPSGVAMDHATPPDQDAQQVQACGVADEKAGAMDSNAGAGDMASQDAAPSSSDDPEAPVLQVPLGSEEAVQEAVQSQDPVNLARAFVAWKEKSMDVDSGEPPVVKQAQAMLTEWRAGITEGTKVDVRCPVSSKWLSSKIVAMVGETECRVHFDGWGPRHDVVMARDSEDIMPLNMASKPKKKPGIKKRRTHVVVVYVDGKVVPSEEPQAAEEPAQPQETPNLVGQTRFGRQVRGTLRPPDPAKSKAKRPKVEDGDAFKTECDEGKNQMKDTNDWACGVCEQLERDDSDRLVLCDGGCKRSFHQECIDMSSAEVDALEEYVCDQCREGEHTCFICGDIGKDWVVGGVHNCSKPNCGKFYHQHCAQQMANVVIAKKQEEPEGEGGPFRFKFICGRHLCDVCGKPKEALKNRSKLFDCLKCTRAYHENCIPPGVKYHEYLLLCPEHCHLDLPHLPGDTEDDTRALEIQGFSRLFSSLPLPKYCPSKLADPNHFRLADRIYNEVHSKPPTYSMLSGLRYLCKPPIIEPGPECQCKDQCDDRCLNRILHVECVGGGPAGEGKQDKYTNCNVGPNCGNRAFKNKEHIKYQVFREYGMGWGLRTLEDVKKGQLVFEYVGEVINDNMMGERLKVHAENHPNDHNMYVMELENGYYLDAREAGSPSRFINHSCDPNCELQKWNVRGYTHIGIMAINDIPAGTPLSYDYQFATNEKGRFKCYCGAAKCRGTLAPAGRFDQEAALIAGGKQNRKKLLELRRKQQEREQARMERCHQKQSLTSHLLPGDPMLEIKAGPPLKYQAVAKETRIFLLRNVRQGFKFLERKQLRDQRAHRHHHRAVQGDHA